MIYRGPSSEFLLGMIGKNSISHCFIPNAQLKKKRLVKKNQQFNIERTTSSHREKYGDSISNIFLPCPQKRTYTFQLYICFSVLTLFYGSFFSNCGSVNKKEHERGGVQRTWWFIDHGHHRTRLWDVRYYNQS
jgi:hypothetical protein